MRFPRFEHLHMYERTHGALLDISHSNVEPFTLREFRRSLPGDLDLDWVDTNGSPELRALIGKRHGVPASHVLVTTGATEANFLVQAALVEPGDRVVVDSPTYTPLRETARGLGGKVVTVDREPKGWRIDLDRVRRAMGPRTRLVVLANLNNPTSARVSTSELRELADLAGERGAHLLVDETFRDLASSDRPRSAATLGPRGIALSTVTKVCGLGALRVGWIAAHPRLLARFKNVKDYTTICGNVLGHTVATWALRRWDFFLRRARQVIDENRRVAGEALEEIPALSGDVPEAGTVWFPRSRVNVTRLERTLLRKFGTVIAHGRFFGMGDHVRIGLGERPARLAQGLGRLRKAIDELS